MKTLQGKFTISRTQGGRNDCPIRIALTDELSGCYVAEIWLTLADFAETLTGLGYVPCTFEYNDSGVIGMQREHKTELLPQPNLSFDRNMKVDPGVDELVAPYEVDGWKARRDDLFNHHHWRGGKVAVTFVRYVAVGTETQED